MASRGPWWLSSVGRDSGVFLFFFPTVLGLCWNCPQALCLMAAERLPYIASGITTTFEGRKQVGRWVPMF